VTELARDLNLAAIYVPSMRNAGMLEARPAPTDRGNAILSTVPLTDPIAIELPFERQRRVTVAATATGGEPWRLLLANAHFDTSLALTRGGPVAARRRQAEALADALEPWTLPTILGGDFNTWLGAREPAAQELRRAFDRTPPAVGLATWYGPMGARFLLDHVFARDLDWPIAVQRLDRRYGSDHHPLLALVEMRAAAGPAGP
jgi:endonuclease/exonuclease/phosphatase family metal-dependent hydrolase